MVALSFHPIRMFTKRGRSLRRRRRSTSEEGVTRNSIPEDDPPLMESTDYESSSSSSLPMVDIDVDSSTRTESGISQIHPICKVIASKTEHQDEDGSCCHENQIECMVCLGTISNNHQVDSLPCGHKFHRNCLTTWRFVHNTCPTCRCELEYVEIYC